MNEYATYQYLSKPARRLAFETTDDHVVSHYEYIWAAEKKEDINEKRQYIIEKSKVINEDTSTQTIEKNVYTLEIHNIRLNVYPDSVYVMIFELANYDHTDLAAIQAINEFGRRINAPYVKKENGTFADSDLNANKITIQLKEKSFCEGFISQLKDDELNLHYIMRPVYQLLGLDGKHAKSIIPAVDDRMFVCCHVANNLLIEEAKQWQGDTYRYLTDYEVSKKLYALFFIDETSSSCQSRNGIVSFLEQAVYDRWVDWGTLYGVTHHSMVALTTTNSPDHLVANFLTRYVEMAIIAVAQRATILKLSLEASELATSSPVEEKIDHDEINKLHKRYILAQNRVILSEVTNQEQGVEMFDLLRESLYIEKSDAELKDQIINLNAVATAQAEAERIKSDKKQNNFMAVLTVAGVGIAIAQFIQAILASQ